MSDSQSAIITAASLAVGVGLGVGVSLALLQNRNHNHEVYRPIATSSEDGRRHQQGSPEQTMAPGLRRGFSMKEARLHAEKSAASAKLVTPREALENLQIGNARFWMAKAHRPERSAFERRALIMSQSPTIGILGCSDSRVPIEIVFDQGLGDLFVIRVAGNCLDTTTSASLEYAVHHLNVKALVVLGHEGCGAVKAAQSTDADLDSLSSNLSSMLKSLKGGLDSTRLANIHDGRAKDREAVVTNVKAQVEALSANAGIMEKVKSKDLIITGAFYEISSGIVDFFNEVAE